MKNYYDILEVSEKASQEVIDKAYKALVKKYHPDLQPQEKKQDAEETLKNINEAYSVLSDSSKRSDFDRQLNMQKEKEYWQNHNPASPSNNSNVNNMGTSNNASSSAATASASVHSKNTPNTSSSQKRSIHNPKVNQNTNTKNVQSNLDEEKYNDAVYNAYNDAYYNAYQKAYVDNLKNMGYTIRYKKTFKENLKTFASAVVAILVLIIVIRLLLIIPPTKKYLLNLYNENQFIKLFVDLVVKIFNNIIGLFKK